MTDDREETKTCAKCIWLSQCMSEGDSYGRVADVMEPYSEACPDYEE
jgi:hypothetical protein